MYFCHKEPVQLLSTPACEKKNRNGKGNCELKNSKTATVQLPCNYSVSHQVPDIFISDAKERESEKQARGGNKRGLKERNLKSIGVTSWPYLSSPAKQPHKISTNVRKSKRYPKLSSNRGHGFINIISVCPWKGSVTVPDYDTISTQENSQLMAE